MKIHSLIKQTDLILTDGWYSLDDFYFIIASPTEIKAIGDVLQFHEYTNQEDCNVNENIHFKNYLGYDFASLYYSILQNETIIDYKLSMYLGENYLVMVVDDEHNLHEIFWEEALHVRHLIREPYEVTLAHLYYRMLNKVLQDIFETLSGFEEILTDFEDKLTESIDDNDFKKAIGFKRISFDMKKHLRLLVYMGIQICANENEFIPNSEIALFKNISTQISKVYDFSLSIHEMTEHLMDLYDSRVTSQTNDVVNRLTIFTFFATPLTVITGLYGMNFVNMPELQHRYGYFIVLGIMACILLTIFLILKRKKWI